MAAESVFLFSLKSTVAIAHICRLIESITMMYNRINLMNAHKAK